MIPKRIHQVWIGGVAPPQWMKLADTWKGHHPDWAYHFWTDADCRPFVAAHYPEFLGTYDSYPYLIQRADAVRYLLLHHYGGIYVDMDIECLRPTDALVADRRVVLVREPPGHEGATLGRCLSNAFMAAEPGHPFFRDIIQALQTDTKVAVTHQDVSDTTGPSMLEMVSRCLSSPGVRVLDHGLVFPYPRDAAALRTMLEGGPEARPLKLSCALNGAHAIHYWARSWHNLSGEDLVNPDPYNVPGFQFFPRLDSVGFALRQGGRNVLELARICAACDAAVAFNTDGFIKSRVRPRRQWETWLDRPESEGLYVKRAALAQPLWRLFGVRR